MKKYLDQIIRGIVTWISIFFGISIWVLSLYAFNWSGVSTVTTWTTLTASLRNTTMSTITWSIQTLQDTMVALTWDQTIAWIKTFSSPIVSTTPTADNQLATKSYVDNVVSATIWGTWTIWWNIWWGLYAWYLWWNSIIVTPAWCTDNATPTCAWIYSMDTVTKSWNDWITYRTTTSATSIFSWSSNTTTLSTADANSSAAWTQYHQAAKYCNDMVYNWYSDWYLPSKIELWVLYWNNASLGGFQPGCYWSSTEFDNNHAWYQSFFNSTCRSEFKNTSCNVRCIRKL
jgi:hypothetical protein